MTILPKRPESRSKLKILYATACPIVNMVGYEDWLDKRQHDLYQLEATLNVGDAFETEQSPDYHAMIYLSEASLIAKPSNSWGRIYLNLCKKYFGNRLDIGDYNDIKLDKNEMYDLKKFKQWIFKTQISHLKSKLKELQVAR